jgi:drug/metabolite transporter (DMT)-like permease
MTVKNFLMLSVVVFLWGSSFALLKLGLEEISPMNLAFLRFLLVLPFFIAFTYFKDKQAFEKSILKDWKILLALGLTGITLSNTFQNVGLQFTTASNSSLIISADPIFIALLDHFYLKEKMTRKRVFGIILAFSGIILIMKPSRLTFNPMGVVGDLLCLGASFSWALYSVVGKKVVAKYGAQRVTMFSMIFGTLFLFPITLVFEKPALPTTLWLWFLLLILSLLCSGVAYLFWFKALEDISPTKAGIFLFFLPIISVSVAYLLLHETLDIYFTAGTLFVILGVAVTERN